MRLNHLALVVHDQQRSIEFYARYFGFEAATARRYPDGVIIVKDADGFALAFGHDEGAQRASGFPHFGFAMAAPEGVRDLRGQLIADVVELVDDEDTGSYVGFKCLDPDGHIVEVAWEDE